MPKIVRVEHPNNNTGPYHSGYLHPDDNDRLFNEHCDDFHPGLWMIFESVDTRPEEGEKWFSGCASLEDLHNWFVGFWDAILTSGHQIVEYVVPDHACIPHQYGQVAFNVNYATERKVLDHNETPVHA